MSSATSPTFRPCKTLFDDVVLLQRTNHEDARGSFGKLYSNKIFIEMGLVVGPFKETIYSLSSRDVIRGMHYQQAPLECSKLVSVVKGAIMDVVVCIKPSESGRDYGKSYSCLLSARNCRSLLIPPGYAHGFRSLEDETIVVYNQTEDYSKEHDKGIHYLSFGYNWDLAEPILSDKDKNLPAIEVP